MDDQAQRNTQGARVLVADDSRVVRAMVSGILRAAGYAVDEAADGKAALARLETRSYDVLITDLKMPGIDGFGVLEAVKARGCGTEVIILTGTRARDVECAVLALRLGAHDFLGKPPSSPTEVILAVDRAVEKRRLREANERLMRELEGMSRTDALTGALNRRAFDEALRREVQRAHRHDLTVALLMADLDHFKAINDTYGHVAGDAVLQDFARRAQDCLREGDTVYRYGGEEFALLLPHADADGALLAAERVVAAVSERKVSWGANGVPVTVSIGVASAKGSTARVETLISQADRALYHAKRTRNSAARYAAVSTPASVLAPAAWRR